MRKLFIDTNIVIDLLSRREPFFEESANLFSLADKKIVELSVSSLTIANTSYTLLRQMDSNKAKAILRSEKNNIEVTALLIRSINLPAQIKQAIENKLKQEQEALAYKFKLEKEKSEAERKRIAAEGEARANKIINNSLTPQLLKMRGIEATIKLSESPNTKVIVIGSGDDGLPLILGNN